MKIGKRNNLKVGSASVHYTEYDHVSVESRNFSILNQYGAKATWQAGSLFRPLRELQTLALECFKDVGNDIVKIRANTDYNPSAIERLCKEKIDQVTDALVPAIKSVAQNMLTLSETVKRGFAPVSPRNDTDVVGFLADQELRTMVRGLPSEDRRSLVAAARQGAYPEIVEAILRANPMLSGLSSESAGSLERAGIAASRADDLEALRQMLKLYDDVMTTAAQACIGLCGMVDNTNGYKLRFEKWRQGCDGSELLRDWLGNLPSRAQNKKADSTEPKEDKEPEEADKDAPEAA
ncbi:hypothetical protein [Pseudomonas piscis]|uniref:Uncharacterized protein n=1 Tax=Pseudomonas piscis TaxID=2614538 RepID=A0A7X1PPU6_9PSED|nr:hypothetical protein [Pseudomonas piscis]MQA55628.1 hypothetical protein [Pseudomonas piscis]